MYKPSYTSLSFALFPSFSYKKTALSHTDQQRKKRITSSQLIIPFFIKLVDEAVFLFDVSLVLSAIAASSISPSPTNGSYQAISPTSCDAVRRPVSELRISRSSLAEAETVRYGRAENYKHILIPRPLTWFPCILSINNTIKTTIIGSVDKLWRRRFSVSQLRFKNVGAKNAYFFSGQKRDKAAVQ